MSSSNLVASSPALIPTSMSYSSPGLMQLRNPLYSHFLLSASAASASSQPSQSYAFLPPQQSSRLVSTKSSGLLRTISYTDTSSLEGNPPVQRTTPEFLHSRRHHSSCWTFPSSSEALSSPTSSEMIPMMMTIPSNDSNDIDDNFNHDNDSAVVPFSKSLRHKLNVMSGFDPLSQSGSTSSSSNRNGSSASPAVFPRVVGHRGALYDELENTRAGFMKCANMGCDAVELDVFLLKDGKTLVVFHGGGGNDDDTGDLLDYCCVEGNIVDLTYDQTQQLRFNSLYKGFPCPTDKIAAGRVSTLEEVLLDLKPHPRQIHIKIELKGPGVVVVEPVLELVDRLEMVDRCEFSSFALDRLNEVRRLRPQTTQQSLSSLYPSYVYKTGALFDKDPPDDFIQQALNVGASEVHLRYDACTKERIQAIHNAGMESMCWCRGAAGMKIDSIKKYWDVGNEDQRCYQALIDTGVSQLCVNRPDVLIYILKMQHDQELQAVNVVSDDDDSSVSETPMKLT